MMDRKCEVYYFSDSQMCIKCGMMWDANDPHPPICEIDNPKPAGLLKRIVAYIFGSKA